MPDTIRGARTPVFIMLFLTLLALQGPGCQVPMSRSEFSRNYLFTGFDVPVNVGGNPSSWSLFVVNEPELLSLDWGVGLSVAGTNLLRYNAPWGLGAVVTLKTNFRNAIEPYAGVTGYGGIVPTGVIGVEPELGIRANWSDSLVAELSAGDLLIAGSNTTTNDFPYTHRAAGLVIGLRVGLTWSALATVTTPR
jgi:hypothetical protein